MRLASRGFPRRAAPLFLVSIVFLALASAAGASRAPTGRGTALRAAPGVKIPRYHGSNRGQYHELAPSSGPVSAWLRARGLSAGELGNSISTLLISPNYAFPLLKGQDESNESSSSRPEGRIGAQNSRSIGSQISAGNSSGSGDPRLMLQVGAVLGLIYVGFLAVWYWATRFRLRPPRSAAS